MKRLLILLALVIPVRSSPQVATVNLNFFSKTPYELIDVQYDMSARAPTGVTLDTPSVTATKIPINRDATAAIIVLPPSSPIPAVFGGGNVKVSFRVMGGSIGDTYILGIHAIRRDTGEHIEGDVTMSVVASQ